MKRILLLFLFVLPSLCQAQYGTKEDTIIVSPNKAPGIALRVSLLGPIQDMKTLRMGVEIPVEKYYSVILSGGYVYKFRYDRQKLMPDRPSFETRIEGRYYLPEKFLYGLYTGAELAYRKTNIMEGVLVSSIDGAVTNFIDPTDYRVHDYTLMGQLGIQPLIGKHFLLDISGGLGLGMHDVNQIRLGLSPKSDDSNLQVGTHFRFESIFGLSAGYLF
jgi:hypothetical protein